MKKIIYALLISILTISCSVKASDNTLSSDTNKENNNKSKEKNKMGTIEMNKVDFLTKIHDYEKDLQNWKYLGDKPALIDFYADWCGPCKQIAPILEELAAEYEGKIYIYKVNVDTEQELASVFGIRSIPSMLFIPMDGQPSMAAGAAPKTELKKNIDEILLGDDKK